MTALFSLFLNAGFFGSVMLLLVLILRPLLRKAPRRIVCILWLFVIVRFLLPIQLESKLSLQPQQVPAQVVSDQFAELPPIQLPVPPITPPVNTPSVPSEPIAAPNVPVTSDPMDLPAVIWGSIAGVIFLYMVVSFCLLRYKIRDCVPCEKDIWESDNIEGAFLLGYIRPQVYLPARLTPEDRQLIIAHEKAHIRRGDAWWKLLGMFCLCMHWYNPLVWIAYTLMSQDIEEACDEQVVRSMTLEQRKSYSYALLNSGKRMSGFLVYPVAFGEVNLKQRIKKVLSYHKPGVLITATASLLAVFIVVCFMTNSPESKTDSMDALPQQIPGTTETQSTEQTQNTTESTGETVHTHAWQSATCSVPKTCSTCGITEGSIATHTYINRKCTGCGLLLPSENLIYDLNGDEASYTARMAWSANNEDTYVVIPASHEGLPVTTVGPLHSNIITGVALPDSITTIGERAFESAYNLESIVLPSGVTTIGISAFSHCMRMTSITLSKNLTSIGDCAFLRCVNLTAIHIPAGVTSIGKDAFQCCYRLTTITYEGTVAQWNAIEKGEGWNRADLNLDRTFESTIPVNGIICSDGIAPI